MGILRTRQVTDVVETRLAQGYSNLALIGERVMPRVLVAQRYGKYLIFGKEGQKIYDTIRGVGADAKRIKTSFSTATYEIPMTHALEAPIDDEEIEQVAEVSQVDLVTQTRAILQESLAVEREKEIATIVTNASNYTNSQAVGTAWTTLASADIVKDIGNAGEKVRIATGMPLEMLTLVVSQKTFLNMAWNEKLIDKYKYTQKGILSADLIAAALGVKEIIIGQSIYTNSLDVTSDIWGTSFGALVAVGKPQSAGVVDPTRLPQSFGYTLQLKGYPVVKQYREESKDSTIVKVKDGWVAKQTSLVGGCVLTGTLAS